MTCPNCGENINNESEYCIKCGLNLKNIQQQNNDNTYMFNQKEQVTQQPINNQKSNKKTILIPIIILLLIIILVFIAIKIFKKDSVIVENDESFLMSIEEIKTVVGRGTYVSGIIERGSIKINDEVQIIGLDQETKTTVVTAIEISRRPQESAEAGEHVDLNIRGVARDEVFVGQVVAKPNSIKAANKFDADVYIFKKEEGGIETSFYNGYKSQFYFRTIDITGEVTFPKDAKTINPGDNVKITVELLNNVAMEIGTEFTLIEDGKTIGKGTVKKVY